MFYNRNRAVMSDRIKHWFFYISTPLSIFGRAGMRWMRAVVYNNSIFYMFAFFRFLGVQVLGVWMQFCDAFQRGLAAILLNAPYYLWNARSTPVAARRVVHTEHLAEGMVSKLSLFCLFLHTFMTVSTITLTGGLFRFEYVLDAVNSKIERIDW